MDFCKKEPHVRLKMASSAQKIMRWIWIRPWWRNNRINKGGKSIESMWGKATSYTTEDGTIIGNTVYHGWCYPHGRKTLLLRRLPSLAWSYCSNDVTIFSTWIFNSGGWANLFKTNWRTIQKKKAIYSKP